MSQRSGKANYWQDAPMPREQLVLIATALEDAIPADHPVRLVDEILEQLDWKEWEATYHGSFGQPPIHPSVMAKILLFAMIRRIRSSRSIEYELKHSIDFMWLASGRRIDHSTLSEFRRKNTKALRGIFQQMIKLAINLVGNLPINPQTKRFDKSAFVYDEEADCYYCPAGKPLPHRMTENTTYRGGKPVERKVYTCDDCEGCPLADKCRKNPEAKRGREVMHDEHEGARRSQRERMKTPEAKAAYSRRQHIGELPFAVIKVRFDMRRFLLRGIEGVSQEWQWASTGFNLTKLMSRWGELRGQLPKLAGTN